MTFGFYGKSKEKDKDLPKEIPENFTPPDLQAMSTSCLMYYLLEYKEMLCSGSFLEEFNMHTLASDISFIYNSLCVETICSTTDPLSRINPSNKQVSRAEFKEVSILH